MSDTREVLDWLDEKPTLSRIVGAARRLDHLHELYPQLSQSCSVLMVRNVTIEPIEPLLKIAAYRAGIHLSVRYSSYDPSNEEIEHELDVCDPDVVLIALRLERLAPALAGDFLGTDSATVAELGHDAVQRTVDLARAVRPKSRAAILVHNYVMPLRLAGGLFDSQNPVGQLNVVRRMNLDLAEAVYGLDGAYVVDVDHLFAHLGLNLCYDDRGERLSDAPLSLTALRALAEVQVRHIRALGGPYAKCVIVDCDNTLWGGVVGEDGIAGLVLGETGTGRKYRDFQQSLLDLRRRGTVLAICSKNEEPDVLDVLHKHPDCLLTEGDFVARRINWNDKADNVASIAQELGLGLEHIVYIDDNPVECEWVKTRLPEVRVVQRNVEDPDAGRLLEELGLFDSLVVTDEDRARTEMYQAEAKRRTARAEVASVDEYFDSLKMVATIGRARPEHLTRLAQLTQRTNQFNFTTRRYDVQALQAMLDDPSVRAVWLDLRDRFGGHGIVGCGIVRRSRDAAIIDTLLVSCRVLGRQAEAVIINRLSRLARSLGASELVGEYIPSARNGQVVDVFRRLGFAGPDTNSNSQLWRWTLGSGDPVVPHWFDVVDDFEEESFPNG